MTRLRNHPLLNECALFDIQRASRVVTSLYNAHLRRSDITIAQFSLLRNIAAMQPVGVGRLAAALAMERTSVTRLVEPLVEAGFAHASPGADRRVRNIAVTPKGAAKIRCAEKYWRCAQAEFLQAVGEKQWRVMRDALRSTVRVVRGRAA